MTVVLLMVRQKLWGLSICDLREPMRMNSELSLKKQFKRGPRIDL